MHDQENSPPGVRIESLDFAYSGTSLFQGLDLTLSRGRVHGLLGLNGAGKTTLLRLLTGLLFPQSGSVSTLGCNPRQRRADFLSRVFMLSEEIHLPPVTARQYLQTRACFYPRFDHDRFEQLAGELIIPYRQNLRRLSYGQKKKFLLAFALSTGAEFIIFDEPTNGLDIPAKSQFRKAIFDTLDDNRLFIVSTHQVRDIDALIDPIIIIYRGNIVFNQSLERITRNLHMTRDPSPPTETEGLVYTEPGVGTHWSLWQGQGDSEAGIDLEILFNAVISNPDRIGKIFGGSQ